MGNDPDVLDEECRDCFGTGWDCNCTDDGGDICYCPFESWRGCPTCEGSGVVLRA